ncbi:hypothetical protein [Pseudomonas quasicaspiana]|nr:hypothetical protein [Pseudomonas quasicaspiana]MCD5972125.1 hypothetical protein [Pseudomonas quasicaspiana]
MMAFRDHDEAGAFIGEITDPIPLVVMDDGRLFLSVGSTEFDLHPCHN